MAQVKNRILISAAVVLYAANVFAQSADPARAHQRLSQEYAIANQPQAALDEIERALAIEPVNPEFLRARGTLATWLGDYARAQDSYRRLLESAPADVDAMVSLARVSAWAGQTDEAVDAYRRYLQTSPDQPAVWLELARTERWRGNFGGALDVLSGYRARFGESTDYSRELAAVLARAGQPARAEAVLEPLLRQDPDNFDLNLTQTIALAMQHRTRDAMDALDTVRRLQPNGAETQELERVVRTLLGSTIEPSAGFYSDSDSLQVSRFAPKAAISLAPGTTLDGGYEREALEARRGSGLEQKTGELDARHDHGWIGLTHRIGAVTLQGHVGRAAVNEAGHDLTTYAIGADISPADGFKLSLERSSAFLVVSPRTIGLGLSRLDHRLQVEWLPTVRTHVSLGALYQELSDGNRRWEVFFSPRRSVARTEWLNVDLGLSAYQFGATRDLDNGYYDPRRYESYSLVAYPYVKLGRYAGLGLTAAIGLQRDDASRTFRFGGNAAVEATFGIDTPWALKVSGSATRNQRLASGAFQGYGSSVALVRRF
jgi:tetratricopeptide (TPR) repeat protein